MSTPRLWTAVFSIKSSNLMSQVRADTPEGALAEFLRIKPFQMTLGEGCGWPEDPAEHEIVGVWPSEGLVGVYECNLMNKRGENALIALVETVDQEWELDLDL